MSNPHQYDILIVGAGMAGAALACALSHQSFYDGRQRPSIGLVETRALRAGWPPLDYATDAFDPRVSAITAASQQFLASIDVWSDIVAQRAQPFEHMHVWDADGTGCIHFDAADVRARQLGHIVENRVSGAALLNVIRECKNIDILDGESVAELHLPVESGDQTQICLSSGEVYSAQLVVAADGAVSRLRELADMRVREWDYGHDAIVCSVETEKPHQQTAWQRFSPSGPVALLPLPDEGLSNSHFGSIVWSQQKSQASVLLEQDDEAFRQSLESALESRLGHIVSVSPRQSFPLRQRHAIDYVKPGFALVADAAHTIHPLAGQGINLGFADVAVLSQILASAFDRGLPLGDFRLLRQYQRQRKGDNLAMMAVVEGFKRLFEQAPPPLRWLRNMGMSQIDRQAFLKSQIIKQAMGI